jgi:hypothetical protein
MLADSVRMYQGLISVLGGGWTTYFVEQSPSALQFGIACIVAPGLDVAGRLFVSVRAPNRGEVAGMQQDFDFSHGPVPFGVNFFIASAEAGEWSVVFSNGRGEIGRRPFRVAVKDFGAPK